MSSVIGELYQMCADEIPRPFCDAEPSAVEPSLVCSKRC
jgi:hypothetical protein